MLPPSRVHINVQARTSAHPRRKCAKSSAPRLCTDIALRPPYFRAAGSTRAGALNALGSASSRQALALPLPQAVQDSFEALDPRRHSILTGRGPWSARGPSTGTRICLRQPGDVLAAHGPHGRPGQSVRHRGRTAGNLRRVRAEHPAPRLIHAQISRLLVNSGGGTCPPRGALERVPHGAGGHRVLLRRPGGSPPSGASRWFGPNDEWRSSYPGILPRRDASRPRELRRDAAALCVRRRGHQLPHARRGAGRRFQQVVTRGSSPFKSAGSLGAYARGLWEA